MAVQSPAATGPPPTATRAEQESARERKIREIRMNPGLWMETLGAILGKSGGDLIKFPDLILNAFQREVIAIYMYCIANALPCRIVIVKPRQEGSSTVCQAILYTHLRNFRGNGMTIAHEKATTDLMMNIWGRYADNDGLDWGNTIDKTKRKFSHGSELHLETANDPNAGMGGTWQAIHATEVAYYRIGGKSSGEKVFESLMNALHALPNTLAILESTANGMEGVHYDTYSGAVSFEQFKAGERGNGYIKVFWPWFAFDDMKIAPRLSQTEAEEVMNTLDVFETRLLEKAAIPDAWGRTFNITADHFAYRRDKLKRPPYNHDPDRFNVDYPPDEETCWRMSGSFCFDPNALAELDAMMVGADLQMKIGALDDPMDNLGRINFSRPPLWTETHRNEAWMRMWEPPTEGLSYVITADFMTGEQAAGATDPDCHAVGVWRAQYTDSHGDTWVPKMVAAINPLCRVDTDVLCRWIGLMARYYGNCLVVPEINNSNGLVSLLRQHGCTIYHRRKAEENTAVGTGKTHKVPGWNTTTATKPQMLNNLAARLREREWSIPCPHARKEHRMMMNWPSGDKKAAPRHHDDWVMMSAMAAMTIDAATPYVRRQIILDPSHDPYSLPNTGPVDGAVRF
jgi:hypothetical protein